MDIYKSIFQISNVSNEDLIDSYSSKWANKFNSKQLNIDKAKAKAFLGSLSSPSISNNILARNLSIIAMIIIKNDISEYFIPEDIDLLIHFSRDQISKNPQINEDIHQLAQFILTHVLLYEDFAPILISKGIFEEMTQNFFHPPWLLGLSYFCKFSIENRNLIFDQGIPIQLLQYFQSENITDLYIYIAQFLYSLCSYPIENQEYSIVLAQLYSELIQLYSKFDLTLQCFVLKALIPFSTLNEVCFEHFKSFHIFQLDFALGESFNSKLTPTLARLLVNVTTFSLDYSRYLACEDNIWELILHYIGQLDPDSSLFTIFYKAALMFARSSINIAYAAPDYFIEHQVYASLINVMEHTQFDLKYLIFTCLYSILAAQITVEQAEFILSDEVYRAALFNDDCSIDIYKPEFFFIGKGIINIFEFANKKQAFELVQPYLESDEFIDTFVNQGFDDDQIENETILEQNKGLFQLIHSAIQSLHRDEI